MVHPYPLYPFPCIAEGSRIGDYAPPDRGLFVCDSAPAYRPRNAEESILYGVVAENLETFLSRQWERAIPFPGSSSANFDCCWSVVLPHTASCAFTAMPVE